MMFAGMLSGMGLKMALLAALVAAGGVFYWHYTNVKAERDAALAQVGALTAAKAVQDQTIVSLEKTVGEWKAQADRFQSTLDKLADAQVQATAEQRKLNDILGKHDLEALSLAKPGLIENRINAGSRSILLEFETATGGKP